MNLKEQLSLKEKVILLLSILFAFTLAFFYGYYLYSRALVTSEIVIENPLSEKGDIEFSIEKTEKKGNLLHIEGWAIKPGELFKEALSQYVLLNEKSGTFYRVRTWTFERLDIGQKYTPNYTDYLYNFDHDFAGMSAVVNLNKLKDKGNYKILVYFDNGITQRIFDSGMSFNVGDSFSEYK